MVFRVQSELGAQNHKVYSGRLGSKGLPKNQGAESSSHRDVFNLSLANPLPPLDSSTKQLKASSPPSGTIIQYFLSSVIFSTSQASKNELLSTPRSPQCRNMYTRQNYLPGDVWGKRSRTWQLYLVVSQNKEYTTQYTVIFMIGTTTKVPRILGNPSFLGFMV